jgi:hypothetical protein
MLLYELEDREMIKKILCITIVAASIAFNAYAYENGDFQIWNIDSQNIEVTKNVKLSMEQEFRFGENASEFYYQHYEWGALFGFDKMLDIAFCYRLVLDKYKHKWREEDQPNVNATLKLDIWKFKIDDRNRIEYRHYRFKEDSARYRNKFGVKLPLEFLKIKVSPYVSDEIFIASDSTGFNENRLSSGVEFELTKYAKADICYMFKSNRIIYDKWNSANVLVTKMKIAF